MRLRERAKWLWARLADFWLLKDILVALMTVFGITGSSLALHAFTPLSPVDFWLSVLASGALSFFVARYFAGNVVHYIRERNIDVRSSGNATLETAIHRAAATPISTAIAHVRNAIHDLNTKDFWPDARRAIRQHALDGTLHVRGRREMPSVYTNDGTKFRDVHEDIPPDYWRDSQIDVGACSFDPRDMAASHTRPDVAKDWHPTDYTKALKHYADLRVNMAEVEGQWPVT